MHKHFSNFPYKSFMKKWFMKHACGWDLRLIELGEQVVWRLYGSQWFVVNSLNLMVELWTFNIVMTCFILFIAHILSCCLFLFVPLRINGAFPSSHFVVDGNRKICPDWNCDASDFSWESLGSALTFYNIDLHGEL